MKASSNHSSPIQSIEELFNLHYQSLCRVAYNLVRDPDAAKDIVQDVFFKLWKNKEEVVIGPAIQSYLFKATRHAALNHLESGKRKTLFKLEIKRDHSDIAHESRESITLKELEAKLNEAIERLPPKCKVIFLLSRQQELKYKQIAEQLDISLKTVENQMGIALERLRQDLKPFLNREFLLILLTVLLSSLVKLLYSYRLL